MSIGMMSSPASKPADRGNKMRLGATYRMKPKYALRAPAFFKAFVWAQAMHRPRPDYRPRYSNV
eukprot:3085136-Karenia_brevis.AAC.1